MRRPTNLRGLPLAVMILTAIVGLIVTLFATFGLGLSTAVFPVGIAAVLAAVLLTVLVATKQLGPGSPILRFLAVWDYVTTAAIIGRTLRAISMKWTAGRNPAIA